MNTQAKAPRLPWIALALSFLAAGVGHIYCGRIGKGLILFCAWLLIPVLAFVAAFLEPSNGVLVGLILGPAVGIMVLYLYAATDAFVTARKVGAEYTLQDYNRGLVYVLLIAIGLIYPIGMTVIVREFAFEAFYVAADSMSPSVLHGDRVLVNKRVRRNRYPRRGDLVALRNPGPGAEVLLKRVIALAGDTIEMEAGEVLVNGSPLAHERVPSEALAAIKDHLSGKVYDETNSGGRYRVMLTDTEALSDDQLAYRSYAATTVPPHNVFVLGDNRDCSQDSRKFGFVPEANLLGDLQYIFSPAASWKRFGAYCD